MNHKIYIALLVAAGVSLTAGIGMAKEHRDGKGMTFEQLDANGDGQITRQEGQAIAQARMAMADTDQDGFLSAAELEAQGSERMKKRVSKMLERMDTDNDGKLSADEMARPERAAKRFERADTDGDGAISKEEYENASRHMGRKHHKKNGDL